MTTLPVELDDERAAAVRAAVSAGSADSVQAAVEDAIDVWLAERTLDNMSDEALRRLWDQGVASGVAGSVDFTQLKADLRRSGRP